MCGSRGGTGGSDTPTEKSQNVGFSSNTGPDPLKNRSYQASIQCWSIIGTSSTKKIKVVKVGPPLRNTLNPVLNTVSIQEDMHPLDIIQTLLTET